MKKPWNYGLLPNVSYILQKSSLPLTHFLIPSFKSHQWGSPAALLLPEIWLDKSFLWKAYMYVMYFEYKVGTWTWTHIGKEWICSRNGKLRMPLVSCSGLWYSHAQKAIALHLTMKRWLLSSSPEWPGVGPSLFFHSFILLNLPAVNETHLFSAGKSTRYSILMADLVAGWLLDHEYCSSSMMQVSSPSIKA